LFQSKKAKLVFLIILIFSMAVSILIRPYGRQDWREMAVMYIFAVKPIPKNQASEYYQLSIADNLKACFVFTIPQAGIYTISTSCLDGEGIIACQNNQGQWSPEKISNVKMNSLSKIATFKALAPGVCALFSKP
jgi:hypothetical protein